MPATIRLLSQTVTKIFLLHTYLIKEPRVEDQQQKRGTHVSTVKQSTRVQTDTDTARCALGWHVMALHCTVLRARELFVLRMRTLAIQHPYPWGKSAIPNKENSPPCPGWGEVGANIDRCIISGSMTRISVSLTGVSTQVTRLVTVELPKGNCEVVLKSLSKSLDKESIRVDGIGHATITEVSYQVEREERAQFLPFFLPPFLCFTAFPVSLLLPLSSSPPSLPSGGSGDTGGGSLCHGQQGSS